MLGTNLNLNQSEKLLINSSLDECLEKLPAGEKPFYLMTRKKMDQEEIFVDGIYMRCIENALLKKAKADSYSSVRCNLLASKIKGIREHFQQNAIKILGA